MPENKPKKIDFSALSSAVYDYDKLQSQYGGERFATRGSQLSKERYNAAWEEFSKANPNADKKNFRSIYTTKAKDEENLTPWQQRARQDVQDAAALAKEDSEAFRAKQQENFAGLDPEQRQIRGKKALQALQGLGGTKTDDIKKILKQVGSGPGVQRNRDLTDDEFAKVQSYLESRSGTSYGDDANQILQGLYKQSPMKRMGDSPFNRSLNIAQGPNYADLSARIGSSVNQAQQEAQAVQDRKAEEERRAMMSEMQQIQLANLKGQQYEALSVAGDTNIPSADEYISNTSRQLVDKQAELVNQLKNNDISTDEFAQMTSVLKSQVPALKATKAALTDFQGTYQGLLESGQLSASNDGNAGKLYNAITSGDMAIEQGDDGKFYINGAGGELHMPLDQVDKLPKPTPKAQPLNMLVKDVAAGLGEKQLWDDDSSNLVRQQLDNMVGSGNDLQAEKTLKSIAVDSLGISLEEANRLFNSGVIDEDGTAQESDDYGNTNQLEQMVEQRMVQEAENQWGANNLKRQKQQAELAYKQAQIDRLNQAANNASKPSVGQVAYEQQSAAISDTIDNLDFGGSAESVTQALGQFQGVGGIEQIRYVGGQEGKKGKYWWNSDTPATEPKVQVKIKGKAYPLSADPETLKRQLTNLITKKYQ